MPKIQTIFVDCDGVLYNQNLLTYEEIVDAGRRSGLRLGLDWTDFDKIHEQLKNLGFRGFYNTVLKLCQAQGISFQKLAKGMTEILDYSKIQPNPELLNLLQKISQKRNVYIFTNNTRVHLEKIFECLFGCTVDQSGLPAITAESTLENGCFHPKRMPGVLTKWCKKVGSLPQNTLMLDDSERVIESAQAEGLQYHRIENDRMTMQILKELNETNKRNSHLRKTSRRIGNQKSASHD